MYASFIGYMYMRCVPCTIFRQIGHEGEERLYISSAQDSQNEA